MKRKRWIQNNDSWYIGWTSCDWYYTTM